MLFHAITPSLKAAITVGIGLFITIIGLTIGNITRITVPNWGIMYHIIPDGDCSYSADGGFFCSKAVDLDYSYFSLGMVRYNYHPTARIAVLGLILAGAFQVIKYKGAIITAIILASFVGINYGTTHTSMIAVFITNMNCSALPLHGPGRWGMCD